MTLVESNIGPPFSCQVNLSGGEPLEVQDNVRREPMSTVILDVGVSISGRAI